MCICVYYTICYLGILNAKRRGALYSDGWVLSARAKSGVRQGGQTAHAMCGFGFWLACRRRRRGISPAAHSSTVDLVGVEPVFANCLPESVVSHRFWHRCLRAAIQVCWMATCHRTSCGHNVRRH